MGILKNFYNGVAGLFDPDRGDEAQFMTWAQKKLKAGEIKKVALQREFAKRGFEASEDQLYFIHGNPSRLHMGITIPAFENADWSAEEKAAEVRKLTEQLRTYGVSDDEIEANKYCAAPTYVIVNGEQQTYYPDREL